MSPESSTRKDVSTEEVREQKTESALIDYAQRRAALPMDQINALQNLLGAKPGDAIEGLSVDVPYDYGFKDRALQLLAERPEFEEHTERVIAGARSIPELVQGLKDIPGVFGADGRFYSSELLIAIVSEVCEKCVNYTEEKGMEKISAENFKVPEFILSVGYSDFVNDNVLIPTSSLGLQAKFIELVNREILSRSLDAEVSQFMQKGNGPEDK